MSSDAGLLPTVRLGTCWAPSVWKPASGTWSSGISSMISLPPFPLLFPEALRRGCRNSGLAHQRTHFSRSYFLSLFFDFLGSAFRLLFSLFRGVFHFCYPVLTAKEHVSDLRKLLFVHPACDILASLGERVNDSLFEFSSPRTRFLFLPRVLCPLLVWGPPSC